MARAMNVNKRVDALSNMVARARTNGAKAAKIANELSNSFKNDGSKRGKDARKIAKYAEKVSRALAKAADALST